MLFSSHPSLLIGNDFYRTDQDRSSGDDDKRRIDHLLMTYAVKRPPFLFIVQTPLHVQEGYDERRNSGVSRSLMVECGTYVPLKLVISLTLI